MGGSKSSRASEPKRLGAFGGGGGGQTRGGTRRIDLCSAASGLGGGGGGLLPPLVTFGDPMQRVGDCTRSVFSDGTSVTRGGAARCRSGGGGFFGGGGCFGGCGFDVSVLLGAGRIEGSPKLGALDAKEDKISVACERTAADSPDVDKVLSTMLAISSLTPDSSRKRGVCIAALAIAPPGDDLPKVPGLLVIGLPLNALLL